MFQQGLGAVVEEMPATDYNGQESVARDTDFLVDVNGTHCGKVTSYRSPHLHNRRLRHCPMGGIC